MPVLAKVVRLINVLYHRRCLTIKEIQRLCGISERTAYRYLNAISEANIPIVFDRSSGGYRIDAHGSFQIHDLNVAEGVLLLMGIRVLGIYSDDTYGEELESLERKLLCRLPLEIDDIWCTFRGQVDESSSPINISELIKSLLIQISVSQRWRLKMLITDDKCEERIIAVDKPSLRFSQHWRVESSSPNMRDSVDVSNIRKVVIDVDARVKVCQRAVKKRTTQAQS